MLSKRLAKIEDVDLYFKWANDSIVRSNSFNQNPIPYQTHVEWFAREISNPDNYFYLFFESEKPVGQVRIEIKNEQQAIIGISIDKEFRGKKIGAAMIKESAQDFLSENPDFSILAYIKKENIPSIKVFENAGFKEKIELEYGGNACYRMTLNL